MLFEYVKFLFNSCLFVLMHRSNNQTALNNNIYTDSFQIWNRSLPNCQEGFFFSIFLRTLPKNGNNLEKGLILLNQRINKLNKFGVEPQAMEQPLDLSVPENKMMLAFYLAAPEVENDRRSLNVLVGMRRAKKEGRYVGSVPKGYSNKRDEQDRAIIVPNEQAEHIRKGFEWLSTGLYSNIEVKKMIEAKFGHYMSISHFHTLIRNPIYIGYVPIKAYKDEKAHIVKGIHEPLISEALFWKVQNMLAKKAKILPPKQAKIREDFPLRAILQCRQCGGSITGSRSKGNGGLYSYYHCQHQCRERFKTESANEAFEKMLESFKFKEEVIDGYMEILTSELKAQQKMETVE
jgi:hypothetical protein